MTEDGLTKDFLRNNRTFASISQFFHTFQSAFRPWPNYTEAHWSVVHQPDNKRDDSYVFSTEDLENMFVDPSLRYQLEELIIRLLRFLTRNRFLNSSTWQEYFSREFDRRESDQVNPFHAKEEEKQESSANTDSIDQQDIHDQKSVSQPTKAILSFFDLPIETRLSLLNTLCEWQLADPERLREHLDNENEAIQWRVDPIGFDAKGNTFWLFDDNRLYRESNRKKKRSKKNQKKKHLISGTRRNMRRSTRISTTASEKEEEKEEDTSDDEDWTPWKMVCMTAAEWQHFPEKYAKSNHVQEQEFHHLLVEDVLPKVLPVVEEHEKNRKKQEALLSRKRSSRILVRELEALEQQQVDSNYSRGATQQEPLSRLEKKRLQREMEQKKQQAQAREERALYREQRLQEKEMAAEKARLERERRLARRRGDSPTLDLGFSANGNDHNRLFQDTALTNPWHQQQQQQHELKVTLTVNRNHKTKISTKTTKKSKKGTNHDKNSKDTLGKRKRGRKPKIQQKAKQEEESWIFNCSCGVHGIDLDDGTPMIACEKCNEWKHIQCLRESGQVDDRLMSFDDFIFICRRCTEEEKADVEIEDTTDESLITARIKKAMTAHEHDSLPSSSSTTEIKSAFTSTHPSQMEQEDHPSRFMSNSALPSTITHFPYEYHQPGTISTGYAHTLQSSERHGLQQPVHTSTAPTIMPTQRQYHSENRLPPLNPTNGNHSQYPLHQPQAPLIATANRSDVNAIKEQQQLTPPTLLPSINANQALHQEEQKKHTIPDSRTQSIPSVPLAVSSSSVPIPLNSVSPSPVSNNNDDALHTITPPPPTTISDSMFRKISK
ncbi:uncharacterized protein BX664DRAFT_332062 [Halteromyces radiatus]|uniref:uncharacterized protein n=1 Tax=Halteromyces radiatus TaxID=101107 RepID=UPI00221F2598|nr:uncharacterized protein BX664DRAFT_332062 [Halteromyces radiatus]KAI8089055.1 hypothetical protein BX664DRAFT_332062 [Halteromyces radiatus]